MPSSLPSMCLTLVSLGSRSGKVLFTIATRSCSTAALVGERGSHRLVVSDAPKGHEYDIQKKLVRSLRRGSDESLLSARGFCRNLTELLVERPANIRLVRELLFELGHNRKFTEANRDAVDGLCGVLRRRINDDTLSRVQGRALGEVALSIGKLELPWVDEMTLITRHCTGRIGLQSMSASAVANVAYGAAKCGIADDTFVEVLASDWLRRLHSRTDEAVVEPASHTMVLRSLAYMFDGQQCVVDLLREFPRRVDISSFSDHQKSQIVWAERRVLREAGKSGDATHVETADLGLVDLATIMTAYARRREAPPEHLKTRILRLVSCQEHELDPRTLANLSRAIGSLLGSQCGHGLDQLLEAVNIAMVECTGPLALSDVGSILWASLASPSPKLTRLASILLTNVDEGSLAAARPQVQAPILSGIVGLGLSQDFPTLVKSIANVNGLRTDWTDDDVKGVSQLVGPISKLLGTQNQVIAIADWVGSVKAELLTLSVAGRIFRGIANATNPRQILTEFPETALRFADAVVGRCKQLEGAAGADLADLTSIMWGLATVRLSHYELQERCCLLAASVLRQQSTEKVRNHLAVFLWALTANSHRTEAAHEVLRGASTKLSTQDLPVLAWAMAVLDHFDERLLRDVLSRCASASLQSAALIRVHRAIEWAAVQYGFQLLSPDEHALAARAAAEARSNSLPTSSSFQDEILRELEPLVSEVYPHWDVVSEYDLSASLPGIVCDIALVDRTSRQPTLLIEADGAAHFVHCVDSDGSRHVGYDGKTELLRRIVKLHGYRLLSIDTNSWKSTLRPDREELLKGCINSTLANGGNTFLDSVSA
ncbi:hypothetical protein Pmar_PMAR010197 [Perkinsus marinus ATCC 50983]|uniref:RAP domain-containing protein n=1 Tax=Perkinsus marinus (strain ATCC 50983 / TXsc) TaxID=423536 RepID=C5K533_PERM5|nr:hypothetical protein Pmar_PMAR010197 [Perkinsus marinus ATCC 50983]EER20455.1 hypothetical protein Pmar_PMAR010197 [Perkinsus marinus ATCC 50983]|eukprot:XP_002788659.1 hypothetical protein Pmar_PMAR010197 [Perkinsus marinus ATCC 50983]